MGRSKFPGKPSKSINRKRISVLQLEDEAGANAAAAASASSSSAGEQQQQQQQQSSEQSAANTGLREKGNNCDNDEDDNAPTGGASTSSTGGAASGGDAAAGGGGGGGGGSSTNSNGVNGSKNNDNGHHKSATQNSAAQLNDDGGDGENKDNAADTAAGGDDDDDSGSETKRPTSSSNNGVTPVIAAALQRARKGGNKKFKNLNLARAEVMLPSTSKLKQQQQLQLNCPLSTSPATAPASPIGNIANPFAAIDARVNESGEDVAMNKLSEMPNEGVAEIAATTAATGSTLPSTTSSNSNQAATTAATGGAGGASVVPSSGMTTGTKQKKTVTFRNVLETSDDKSVVKRFYNPDNRMPIVSIMKKDSLNRPLTYSRNSECIVRPSILSKILNKNSNIDKLNSLKFRSAHVATSCETQIGSGTSANVFGSGLSRAFGAPLEDDDIEMGGVTFHRNKSQESQKNNDDDDVNIEDDEDAEEDPQENEDDNDDGSASEKSAETATEKDHVAGDDKQLVMDKHFILPKRTRSSRIIKPNKRLLDDGGIVSKKHPNEANSKTKTKNYFSLKDKPSISASSSSSTSSISTSTTVAFSSFGSLKLNSSFVMRKSRLQFQQIDQTGPFGGISVPAMSFGLSSPSATATSSTTTTTNNNPASVSCAVCATSLNTNEVPQSRKYGVLVCDVCRKFISKMTKKAVSISSSSAAQPVNQQQLQCKQTEGGASCCSINSAKSQLKNFKKLYKDRCTACWLKKCLRALQLPMAQKNRLTVILPPNMRNEAAAKDDTTVALLSAAPSSSSSSTTSTSIKWKSTTETSLNIKSNPLAENNVTFGSTPLLRPAILEKPLFLKDPKVSTTAEPVSPNAPTSSTSETTTAKSTTRHKSKQDKPTKDMESEKPALSPTLKKVSTETVTAADLPKDEQLPATANSTSLPGTGQIETNEQAAPGDNLKRQRIDLKGPRVKHVCRSASIVLGQPLATFGEEEEEQQQQQQEEQAAVTPTLEASKPAPASASQMITDENDNCASCKTTTTPSETVTESKTNNKSLVNTQPEPGKKTTAKVTTRNAAAAAATSVTSVSTLGLMGNKKLNSNNTVSQSAANPPSRRSKEVTRQRTLISIDFWENYDPAEVCQTGFGLIVTETVAQRALCFLCGSTGLDPLIFCACCCEPYHQYCVQDEYNLKHSSFEDTTLMNSLLDTSVNPSTCAPSMNQLTQRLNWLCPRCTVCYTCNMSSGSKVKCQKCQKNYHATCLGTSKRLLGADRPLICVNCLKCKSCSTTKVSKFVGNLPMCTACFKLRKKGNYCPICQKCYDDNDFDLKMMECGDCNQWVHSKCEGLSDEQYNLLSTLPESIEFICKKCARRNESSHIKADEWRQAVMEEFKSSLYSVLKLLSKSRQACALLKLSPRKKLRCICGAAANGNINSSSSQGKLQPKALQFSGSDGESQNSDDVYEFKDQQISKSLNPHNHSSLSKSCSCLQPSITQSQSFSLVDIKQKIAGNTYVSLAEFNYDMSQVIQQSQCDELDIAYKELLSEQFPWFQNETKACTDALEEDMFESCGGGGNYDDLQEESPTVYVEHTVTQGAARSGVLDIPLDVDVDDLGSCGIKMRLDSRVCLFCRKSGEGLSGEEARLLYCGHDCWVHTNCAMWSAEVFEEIDGSLQNVHSAVARGRMIKCVVCGNRGATVGCNVRSCGEHYHYPCARSIDCAFLTDKTMYCPAHAKNGNALKANGSPSVTYESNFEVSRPVYVELDRKRKKLIEPAKVQFHIGSLEVRQLGSIVPRFSDSFEALIPINFLCSRLYWSSKEPWKIVEYTVRTTIQNSYSSTVIGLDVGRNFTVDHSHTNSNMMLAKIARWHNSLSRNDLLTDTDWAEFPNVPTDENTEEEPQQNADLLPPEIKDAIFEDLPHDLLDGISMLDIFMYEDLGDKGELFAMSEQSKDGTIAPSQSQTNNQTVPVSICDDDTRNSSSLGGNYWPASNPVEDAMLSAVRSSNQVQVLKTRAWPKLDGNSVAAIKRRKLSKNLAEGMLLSLSNQQRTKKEMATVAGVSRRQSTSETCTTETSSAATGSTAIRSSNKNFTWSAAKRYFEKSEPREETAKLRIMQMDGVDDSITEFRIVGGDGNLSTAQFTGQVKCERCQCTYRNYESFQRHLPTCEPMSTSESESEATNAPTVTHLSAESFNEALQKQALAAATLGNAGGINYLQTSYPQVQNLGTLGQFGLQGLQPLQLQPQSLGNGFFLSQANHNPAATTGNDDLQLYANSLQSLAANLGGGFALTQPTVAASAQPQLIAVSTNPDGTQQFIQLPHTSAAPQAATYQTLQATNTDKKIMLPLTTAAKPLKTVATKAGQQATAAAKQKQLKSAHQVKPIQAKLQPHPQPHPQQQQPITATATTTQLLGQSLLQPQLLFQSNAQAQAPQLILPQTQPQNIISFVTGDGSQAQPLQYISIPATNDFKHQQATATPTFLTTAAPGAGATFLQTDASGNLMLTTAPANSGLQMLAAPMQAQPQVIGTLIQPQTLQLATAAGATAGDGSQGHTSGQQPLILGGTTAGGATGLEFATTTPQVILATQPMYYGLETIVQNTVMSSQQFVSTAMPGVLSQNASFSATTTQVFQASKIEPIVDLPAGYVVLNNPGADGTAGTFLNAASVLQQQQHQQQQHTQEEATTTTQLLQNANFQFQTVPTSATSTTSMADFATSSPLVVTAKIPPVTQMKRKAAAAAVASGVSAAGSTSMPGLNKMMQPQVVNKVLPTSIATSHHAQVKQNNANLRQTVGGGASTLKTKHTPGSNCGAPPSIASKPLQKKTNLIRPIHKVEVKPKVMKPIPKLSNPVVGGATTLPAQSQQHPHPHTLPIVSQVVQQRLPQAMPQQQPSQQQTQQHQQQQQQQLPVISIPEPQQIQQMPQQQQSFSLETQEPATDMINRVQHFVSSSLPTNVVNPLQQQPATITTSSRPTNRVLPMQQRQEPPVPLINDPVVPSSPTPPKPTEQPIIVSSVSSGASKCYAPKASPSTVYETELKMTETEITQNHIVVPPSTITAINTMLEHPQEQIITETFYEKQPSVQQLPEDKCNELLLQAQQQPQTHLEIVDNGYLMEKHGFQMETEPLPMESNEHFTSLKEADDIERVVDEEDDDDDFSLKMATSACQDHEMSDCEEPAVKEKISKILDNLTNDDCADSIATATTAEVESSAGYQQMVEDVLATTAAAAASASSSASSTEAAAMPNDAFEATAEETAAVEAAASYINEMAEAHVLELKQLQNGVELELKTKEPPPPSKQTEQSQLNEQPTAAAPEPPPPIREPKKISGPHLLYEIQSEDGFTYKSSSIAEIWEKVFEAVQVARRAHGLTQLPEGPLADMGGIQMIGLKTNALKYLIEQLPGVEKCSKYTPKYHKRNGNVSTAASSGHLGSTGAGSTSSGIDNQPLLDYGSDQDDLQENAYDCARCEPYATRSEYDMFSWLASRHRKQPIQVFVQPSDNELVPRRGTGSNLPMAMKYRTLKETYKDYVGVFRSHIHGRGLYCTKDIEAGEMVIEYAGELIRSTLTDKRERYYDSRGIGCYMFKIDDNLVVDATMRGNAARFINHSCEPNCYSKVVDILGHKHIIIFALRRIVQGEELTYDYKFPFEEEKIPCSCGSKRCRKYLN